MILRRTAQAVWPHRWGVALGLAQMAVISAFELLKPWPLQLVIDSVLGGAPVRWPLLAGRSRETLLAIAAGGLVLVWIACGALAVWNNYTTISTGQRMVDDLRGRLYAHLQHLSLSFHARAGVGDLLYRVTADTYAIQTLAMNGLFPVASAVLLLGGMVAVMAQLNAALTLVALTVAPLLLLGILLVNARLDAVATEVRARESAVYQIVQRNLAAIRIVQAFSAEQLEARRFQQGSRASLRSSLRLYTLQTAYGATTGALTAAGTATVLVVGSWQVWNGRLSVGEMVVFVSYLASLYGPLNALVNTYGLVRSAAVGVRRVFEVLDGETPLRDGAGGFAGPVRGAIELAGVDFVYPDGTAALHGVDLRIGAGEHVAVIGPTGAGKSTLVSLIPRFADPSRGAVRVDGVDLRDLRLAALRREISMVLQPAVVLPMSVRDNIAYGRPDATQAEVEEAARLAQAAAFIARLPEGYDTMLGEQGATLSEGERQRLTIARALVRRAPILIFDEPTAALDVTTEAALMAALDEVMRGRTAIVIAHRLSTVMRADRVVVLEQGRVVEQGRRRSCWRAAARSRACTRRSSAARRRDGVRVVVTGLVAAYPLGGVSWDYLAYVDGFRRLGAEVLYLEDTGAWFYQPAAETYGDDPRANLAYLERGLARIEASDVRWAVRAPDDAVYGPAAGAVGAFCRGADLFLNVSGSCWLRDEYRGARRTAYLDTDPGFTQATLQAVERGTASADQRFSAALIHQHDRFLTYAEAIDDADCRVPRCGLAWKPTRQPIVLDRWRVEPPPPGAAYTTVMSWAHGRAAPVIDGVERAGKDAEMLRFLDLPARSGVPLELAVGGRPPRDELAARGWRVVDAWPRSATMDVYQDYLRGSRGEWSVAKQVYVALRSGWFSTRSAAYLASGRPVVVQDTGWSAHYPHGEGLFAFATLDEAAAALAAVEADHARHAAAARAVAEQELAAERVLSRLLRDVE
ncbi:MAG: ABC transporter ATP-binding protein [Candidatus Binatia bacterium]